MTSTLDDARGELLALAVEIIVPANGKNGGLIRLSSGREIMLSKADAVFLRAAPVPQCDAESTEALQQTIIDAWNAFGAYPVKDIADAESLAIIGDGDLAEQIKTLIQQRDTAEAALVSPPSEAGREAVAVLENLDALDKQRTPGPWKKTHDNITVPGTRSLVARCDADWSGFTVDMAKASKNARFIVALENAWPKIRAALSRPDQGTIAVDPT